MKYKEILEIKKRIDFNLTEPETLIKLVKDAQSKGEKAQKDMDRLRRITSGLTDLFEKRKLLLNGDVLDSIELSYKTTVGIDGSFQLVGGVGGKWYAPISIARVIFPDGLGSKPKVDIFWAGIEEIQERSFEPMREASIKMLTGESKAILNWGISNKEAIVFIDGPIVDPPWCGNIDYIKFRCDAIKKCSRKSLIIGCVKRSRDKFYIDELMVSKEFKNRKLSDFPSDQHLMAYIFANLRHRGYYGPIFTRWIDISNTEIYKLYKQNGVYVLCLFFQKSASSPVLRLDVPFLSVSGKKKSIDRKMLEAVKAASEWTYPGQDYPLPVFLAHEKCNIREGCAEVLYEEIITKSKSVDPLNQIISLQLR